MANFKDVDLGADATIRRMVKARQKDNNELIEECAQIAEKYSIYAANLIRAKKAEIKDG